MHKSQIDLIYDEIIYIENVFYDGDCLILHYKNSLLEPTRNPCFSKEDTVPYYNLLNNLIKK